MTQEDSDDLPGQCDPEMMADMAHIPGRAAQLALRDKAYEILEIFKTRSGRPGTRLSNAWLGEHDWRVQLLQHWDIRHGGPEMFVPLVAALQRGGITHLCGTYVDAEGITDPTAVWRIPLEAGLISSFFGAHRYGFHILLPEDRSFAIHAMEDVCAAFAGPEAFLREALLPEFQGEGALADLKDAMDEEYGEAAFASVLAHYGPFLLEDSEDGG
ncbi:MAG: hypothetical protein K5Q68_02155 [Roseococcus sp.]|nr:hypothetical protein [Roseococcus sp.]